MAVNRLKLSFNAYEHNLLLSNMSYNATIYMTLDTITLFYYFILITNYELLIMYKTLLWNNYIVEQLYYEMYYDEIVFRETWLYWKYVQYYITLRNYISHRRIIFQIADLWKRDPD